MFTKKQKILVTGANGLVGSAVKNELENRGGYEIYGLAGQGSRLEIHGKNSPEKIFRCDVADFGTFPGKGVIKKSEVLIHAAGLAHQFGSVKEADFWRVNVLGTENICRLARQLEVEHFVLISSVSVYGDHGSSEIDEDFECKPSGFYAESKLESENRAIDFCEEHGIPLTILRLSTVIGEGDRGNTARLITLIDKKRFFWIGSGKNKKSLIYKDDVAGGVARTIEEKRAPGTEIYNLTAEAVSMKEIVEVIAQNLGRGVPGWKIPERLVREIFRVNRTKISVGYLKNLEKTVQKWLADDIFSGSKFYDRFKYGPGTSVPEALGRQVGFYLSRKGKTD